jgi:probable phosphoglycerate mutase
MARLLLVRHAPTAETGKKLTGRLPGVSLGESGLEIAKRTAERMASIELTAIYSSPIERTWETAVAIAAHHRAQPIAHDGLLEVDYGDWSGRSLGQLAKLAAWKVVQMTPSRMTFPNGESLVAAQARAVASCEEIARKHRRGTVALVTHADVIKAAVSHFLGQPLDLFQRIGVAPASVTVIDLPRQGPPTVVATNTNGDPATWR